MKGIVAFISLLLVSQALAASYGDALSRFHRTTEELLADVTREQSANLQIMQGVAEELAALKSAGATAHAERIRELKEKDALLFRKALWLSKRDRDIRMLRAFVSELDREYHRGEPPRKETDSGFDVARFPKEISQMLQEEFGISALVAVTTGRSPNEKLVKAVRELERESLRSYLLPENQRALEENDISEDIQRKYGHLPARERFQRLTAEEQDKVLRFVRAGKHLELSLALSTLRLLAIVMEDRYGVVTRAIEGNHADAAAEAEFQRLVESYSPIERRAALFAQRMDSVFPDNWSSRIKSAAEKNRSSAATK